MTNHNITLIPTEVIERVYQEGFQSECIIPHNDVLAPVWEKMKKKISENDLSLYKGNKRKCRTAIQELSNDDLFYAYKAALNARTSQSFIDLIEDQIMIRMAEGM